MRAPPYCNEPDVFELALPRSARNLQIAPFESEWGQTDELLCYYNKTLIGLLAPQVSDPNFLGADTNFIFLLPKLDTQRSYVWPERVEYENALSQLLSSQKVWHLRCEHDCDQSPIERLCTGQERLKNALHQAHSYCAGEPVLCPSFEAWPANG